MTITNFVIKNIVVRLLSGQDYRAEIVTMIDAEFLQFAIGFFRRVAEAKLNNSDIDVDWYKKEMLNEDLTSDDIIIHAGLNKKTITNMHNTAKRSVVIDASNTHYGQLHAMIENLTQADDIDLTLQIKFNKVSVELNINESLIVINSLAVKRSALRGGLWSTAGKQAEGPLMLALCGLFDVPKEHYAVKPISQHVKKGEVNREVDFFLYESDQEYKCEVKLMGRGNPESADAVVARGSHVFVADKLSDQNKTQLTKRKVQWVELRSDGGYQKFGEVLSELNIPHNRISPSEFDAKINQVIDNIL